MSPGVALNELQQAMQILLMIAGPLLIVVLLIGVVFGVLQAATQINEPTIAFVAKAIALAAVLGLGGAWFLGHLTDYTSSLIMRIPSLVTG